MDEGDWRKTAEQGAERFVRKESLQGKPGLDYRMK